MDKLNVKVGDKVIYEYMGVERIVTISKITPTGRIKIDFDDSQFNCYGDEIGRKDAWNHPFIREATSDDIERIDQKQTIIKAYELCHTVETKNITYEKALKIIEIFGNES